MKCPYCNQEHPVGTKFCPQTGKQIQQLLSCPNSACINHGKYTLPLDSRFCPDCGTPIQVVPSGNNIFVNDIVLGQTTLRELRQKGYNIKKDEDDGIYTIDLDDESVCAYLFCATYREVEEFGNRLVNPSVLNEDFVLNRRKTVSAIAFDSFDGSDVFKELGLSEDCDEDETIDILEENGYMQIENILDDPEIVVTFVREHKDSAGNTIFLMLSNDQSGMFCVNIANEWKSHKTGETFYAE